MKATTKEKFNQMAASSDIVPVYREIPGDMETPVSILKRFAADENVVLLESAEGGEKLGRYSFLGVNPYGIFYVKGQRAYFKTAGEEKELPFQGNPLNAMRELIGKKRIASDPDLPPLPGGAIGFLSYEAAGLFEELPPPKGDREFPDCMFMLTNEVIAFDNLHHTIKVIVNVHTDRQQEDAFEQAQGKIADLIRKIETPLNFECQVKKNSPVQLIPEMKKEDFLRMVEKAKHYIVEGDIIQVVPSQSFSAGCSLNPFDLYRALRLINPSPYLFYLKLGEKILIGSSPETLGKLRHGVAQLRPIAGTRPRGKTPESDVTLEKELLADEKEKAEHLMLVDLGRNDIGRIAEPGSVKVSESMHVERFSHVMHLVSTVSGQLKKELDAFDLVAAIFPAGTLSGAPKIRAMEIIHELEEKPRGPYGGAVGYFSYDGCMDLAITIRTIEMHGKRLKVQAGCGIVADSVPEKEYQETINKAQALFKAVEFAAGGLK